MHGAPNTVFDRSNCGSGVVRWCTHHLLQLGPPWGTGAMPPHPTGGRTLLDDLGGPRTHHQDHIRRCRHRIRPFVVRIVRFGCHTVVCTLSAARATMGHWGQCTHTPRMAGHWLITLGGHTHTPPRPHSALPTPYSTVRGSNCAVRVSYGGAHTIFSS